MEPMGGAARPGKDSYTLLGRVLRPIQLREKLVTGQVGAEAEAAAMAPGDSIEIAWIHPQEPVVRVSIKRRGFDDLPGTDPGNHLDRIGTTQEAGPTGASWRRDRITHGTVSWAKERSNYQRSRGANVRGRGAKQIGKPQLKVALRRQASWLRYPPGEGRAPAEWRPEPAIVKQASAEHLSAGSPKTAHLRGRHGTFSTTPYHRERDCGAAEGSFPAPKECNKA